MQIKNLCLKYFLEYNFNIWEYILIWIIMIQIDGEYFISFFKIISDIFSRKEKRSPCLCRRLRLLYSYMFLMKSNQEDRVWIRYGSKWNPQLKIQKHISEWSINRINLIFVSHECSCIFHLITGFQQ